MGCCMNQEKKFGHLVPLEDEAELDEDLIAMGIQPKGKKGKGKRGISEVVAVEEGESSRGRPRSRVIKVEEGQES